MPSTLTVTQGTLVRALHALRNKAPKTQCPDWALLRVLSQDVCVVHVGGEIQITVGPTGGQATLTATPSAVTTGDFEALRCGTCRPKGCVHQWAFALAWVLDSSEGRELLRDEPIEPTPSTLQVDPPWPTSIDPPPPSPLRFQLRDNSANAGIFVDVMMLPRSSRTGRLLGMRPAPKKLDAIIKKVGELPRGDWEAARRLEQLTLLEHMAAHHYSHSAQLKREIHQVRAELMVSLTAVTHLEFEGRLITCSPTPWEGEVLRHFDSDRGLAVQWVAACIAAFDVGSGFVIDADGVLRPAAPKTRPMLEFLGKRGARFIGIEDLPRALSSPLGRCFPNQPAIRTELVPERGTPTPSFSQTKKGKLRHLDITFNYGETSVRWADPIYLVEPVEGRPPRVYLRDIDAELKFERSLLEHNHPGLFTDSRHTLGGQTEGQPNPGRSDPGTRPTPKKARPISPSLSFEATQSGLRMELSFSSDSYPVPPQRIADAWNTGQTTLLRLDGRPATVPRSWLTKYGELLEDLVRLNDRHGEELPHTVIPLIPDEIDIHRRDGCALEIEAYQQLNDLPDGGQPDTFQGQLRSYQRLGYQWLRRLHKLELGGLLADDMGLGKTIQAIALLAQINQLDSQAISLIVAPTSVLVNWREELQRFAPDLPVALYYGKERTLPDRGVVITTYAMLRRCVRSLAKPKWETVILDEAQAIKNPSSQTARAARRVKGRARYALTGTPFENDLDELWSVMEFVLPGFFGRIGRFKKDYRAAAHRPNSPKGMRQVAHLRRRIAPFVLRRLKTEVIEELPDRQIQIVSCELSDAQRKTYSSVESRYRRSVAYRIAEVGFDRAKFMILEALTRLRQAACDPALLPGIEDGASAKRERLRKILQESVATGRRVLVFSQWPSFLRRVIGDLAELQLDYLYLDGQTKDRASLQRQWNQPDGPPVFLISLKAGGSGLNLVGADTVVHLDPWWNPAVEAQAMDRCYRIGQTRSVVVYKLIAHRTVEDRVVRTQSRKQALFDAFFSDEPTTVGRLELTDLQLLFGAPAEGEPPLPSTQETPSPNRGTTFEVERDRLPSEIHELLNVHGKLTNQSVRSALNCSADVARRRLKGWAKSGLLIRRGRRQNTRYLPG